MWVVFPQSLESEQSRITCNDDNPASARIIEAACGVLENAPMMSNGVRRRRYWVRPDAPAASPGAAWEG